MAHILIVEDEQSINDLIAMNLELVEYTSTQVYEGNKALECLKQNTYSLIILDIMLPGLDGFYHLNFRDKNNKDLESPEWKNKAVQEISKLIPESLTITSSKVVFSHPLTGVTVVSELSDGSAYAVRLVGESKKAAVIIYFPDGYDGSFDSNPLTDNAVG